ncbi:MAG: ATP-binding protein [Dehalococcoidia bacterium]
MRRVIAWFRADAHLLQLAATGAVGVAFAAHLLVTSAVLGGIDRVVLAVDATFALLAVAAAGMHLQQLGRDRRRQRLIETLTRSLSTPRDVTETATAAAALLIEMEIAQVAVVAAVRQEPGRDPVLEPIAFVGSIPGATASVTEQPLTRFERLLTQREDVSTDPLLQGLGALGARPVVARVPLRRGSEFLGALLLVSREADVLGDRQLLTAVGVTVATALDNARLYQATVEQARDLEVQDARRREFLYAISHELRTPLTSIRAFAELLTEERASRRGRRDGSDEEAELLASLSRGVDRLSDLVEDLLQLGRSEEVETRVELAPVDAGAALRAAESIIKPSFLRRHQPRLMQLPARPAWVLGDMSTLEQVLINLLSNANRHSPEGGLITATLSGNGDRIRIEVSDSGPGVPAAERDRIFEPFYRVAAGGAAVPGSGLGLAIARRGIDDLNGRIWVEDGDGMDPSAPGARFCVDLPAIPPEFAPAAAEQRAQSRRAAPRALQEAVDDATQLHLELQQRDS